MNLRERLDADMKAAMKARDGLRLDTIRGVRGAIRNKEIEAGGELDDAAIVRVIRTLVKQRSDSIEQYRAAVKRWPDSAMSLNALGYTLADRTDRYREAEKLIRKAIKKDPDSAAIIDSLGWVLFKLGRYEEALTELERAYEKLPDPEVASHIVDTLAALERHDEALQFLEEAESRSPDDKMLRDVRERVFPDPE